MCFGYPKIGVIHNQQTSGGHCNSVQIEKGGIDLSYSMLTPHLSTNVLNSIYLK